MAHIWNEKGKFPHEILDLPPFEREFIYQATQLKIDADKKAGTKKGGK